MRVAKDNGVKISVDCEDGECGSCVVTVKETTSEAQTHYMEDKEINTLVSIAALSRDKGHQLQQDTLSHSHRLACQYLIKGDIEVKPYVN